MTQSAKDPRMYLAAERTLLAWIRTGLALMGFGFVVARFGLFLREIRSVATDIPVRSSGFSLWTGTALVLIGVIVNAASTVQYVRIVHNLNEGRDMTSRPSTLGVALAALLCVAGVAMAAYLVIVR
jgi:putative membrane protein